MGNSAHWKKEEIIDRLNTGFADVEAALRYLPVTQLFGKKTEKWSAAENVEHLILSVKPLSLAFRLPKWCIRFFGKPNRVCRTYEEIVHHYQAILQSGGKAAPAYIPHLKNQDKEPLLLRFTSANQKLLESLQHWSETDFDRYLLPHPLLGKLMVREMLYFTAYHTQHHLTAVKNTL